MRVCRRRLLRVHMLTPTALPRQRRRRFQEYYYSGSYYGAPASNLLYELAQQLNRENNDMLWLSIVGGTEQFLLQQCDADQYNLLVAEFQKEVLAKNTEKQQSTEASDGTMIPVEGSGIWFENEYRFMLHRHWSLFDSMHHSAYIASRLGTWKSSGESSVGERRAISINAIVPRAQHACL